jgi:hypothetical protein
MRTHIAEIPEYMERGLCSLLFRLGLARTLERLCTISVFSVLSTD